MVCQLNSTQNDDDQTATNTTTTASSSIRTKYFLDLHRIHQTKLSSKRSSSLNNLYKSPSASKLPQRVPMGTREQKLSQSEFDIYLQIRNQFSGECEDEDERTSDFSDDDDLDVDVDVDMDEDAFSSTPQKCDTNHNITVIHKPVTMVNDANTTITTTTTTTNEDFLSSSPSLSIGDYKSFMSEDIQSTVSSTKTSTSLSIQKADEQHQQQQSSSPSHTVTNSKSANLLNDVTSLCSFQSNYSQFDYYFNTNTVPTATNGNSAITPAAPPPHMTQSKSIQIISPTQQQQQQQAKKFTFSFFNRFTNQNNNSTAATHTPTTTTSSLGLFNKLFNNSTDKSQASSDTVPNTVLILENRPSNLPAKSVEEAQKHRQEYEKMVEAAKKKELKEKEIKVKKYEQQLKKEDFMANSLRIWNTEIIPNWSEHNSSKRTHQLWWHGLPPSIRGKVWKLAIGNELELTNETYETCRRKAEEKIEILSKKSADFNGSYQETSVELVKLDVSRTFPQLRLFQQDGPFYNALHNVLSSYACYNTRIGYVQGMSFLAGILLLNMEENDAFICLSNLLNTNYLIACFRMDQYKMNCYFKIHEILFEHNLPKLYRHFEKNKVKPDLYLIEWIFTLFSKSLPLDVVSRVWDVYLRDKDEFLFRTALGILNLYQDILLKMDFIHCVQYLMKLPEDINSTQLFKSIEQMKTTIDTQYLTFDDLVKSIVK